MNWNKRYFQKAKRISNFLSFMPFIRIVVLTGSVAKAKAKKESDIDLFIVTRAGRIWTARFLVVLFLKAIGQYRTDKCFAGKICPNRFHSKDALKIYPENEYHKKEYSRIISLFDAGGVCKKFMRANGWPARNCKGASKTGIFKKLDEWLLSGWLGDYLEQALKKHQMNRILNDSRTYQGKARIIIKEGQLCFHPEAR